MTGSQDGVFESGVREPVPRDRETAARFAPGFACGRDIGFRGEVRQERDNRLGAEPGRVAVAMHKKYAGSATVSTALFDRRSESVPQI